jgi:exopolyphosphatase
VRHARLPFPPSVDAPRRTVSVALTSYKTVDDRTGQKTKHREIFVGVRHDRRLDSPAADSLFAAVVAAIERSAELDVRPWERVEGEEPDFGHRRRAWRQLRDDAGRKVVRPVVEKAVQAWLDAQAAARNGGAS